MLLMQSNVGVGDHDRAAQKAPEVMTDRQKNDLKSGTAGNC